MEPNWRYLDPTMFPKALGEGGRNLKGPFHTVDGSSKSVSHHLRSHEKPWFAGIDRAHHSRIS